MKLVGKKLGYYYEAIKIPMLIYIVFSFVRLLIAFIPGKIGQALSAVMWLLSLALGLMLLLYIGYTVTKNYKGGLFESFFAGGISGIIITLTGILTYLVSGMLSGFRMLIFIVMGLTIFPILTAGISAGTSFIIKEFNSK